ncbi:MAG: prolipoprotein diacylglyceryl transferase [Holosporales bacterium]|jgi:phosphatidylglycerol:prolipoprotein diacylglycerol transferase|nr:prolipoprotein diacylglyceryl transferase [Holosporales bacterium]
MFIWSTSPIAFTIGTLNIYWYGIIYATALISSWAIATWLLRILRDNKIVVPSKEEFDSFVFCAIISIIVGARIGHVLFFDFEYYLSHPSEIVMIRNGGLSFHGAIIGLAIYSYRFVRKVHMPWKLLIDILSIAGAFGVGVGRIANFMNQELYGKISTSEMSVVFSYVDHMPRYPTQLFESFFEGFLNFWLLFIVFKFKGIKVVGSGVITSLFCIMYSSSRFVIEFFKEVETYTYFKYVTLTVGQTLSIPLFIFGIFVLYFKLNNDISSTDIGK